LTARARSEPRRDRFSQEADCPFVVRIDYLDDNVPHARIRGRLKVGNNLLRRAGDHGLSPGVVETSGKALIDLAPHARVVLRQDQPDREVRSRDVSERAPHILTVAA